jgi:hypothetical protein
MVTKKKWWEPVSKLLCEIGVLQAGGAIDATRKERSVTFQDPADVAENLIKNGSAASGECKPGIW